MSKKSPPMIIEHISIYCYNWSPSYFRKSPRRMLQFGLGSCHGQSGRSQYLSTTVPLYPLFIYPYPYYPYIHIRIIHIRISILLLVLARAMSNRAGRSILAHQCHYIHYSYNHIRIIHTFILSISIYPYP